MSSLLSALHRPSTGSAPTPHNAIPSATYCQRPALCRAAARNLPSYNYDVRIDHNRQFPRKSTTFATPAEHKSWCTWESARLSHKSCPGDKRVEKRGRGEGGGTAKAVGVGIWRVAAASEVGEGEQGGGGRLGFSGAARTRGHSLLHKSSRTTTPLSASAFCACTPLSAQIAECDVHRHLCNSEDVPPSVGPTPTTTPGKAARAREDVHGLIFFSGPP